MSHRLKGLMRSTVCHRLFWMFLIALIGWPITSYAQSSVVWCVCLKPNGEEQHYTHQKYYDIADGCRKNRATIVPRGLSNPEADKACRTGRIASTKPASTTSTKSAKKKKSKGSTRHKARSAPIPKLKAPGVQGKPDTEFNGFIAEAAKQYAIPELLVHAVIRVESNYKPQAVSSAGAEGLMQLMPATAKDLGIQDSFNPRQNIQGGTRYLKRLSDRFDSDVVKTLAGYHAGFRAVEREDRIPFTSTEGYVKKVLGHYYRMKQAEEVTQ